MTELKTKAELVDLLNGNKNKRVWLFANIGVTAPDFSWNIKFFDESTKEISEEYKILFDTISKQGCQDIIETLKDVQSKINHYYLFAYPFKHSNSIDIRRIDYLGMPMRQYAKENKTLSVKREINYFEYGNKIESILEEMNEELKQQEQDFGKHSICIYCIDDIQITFHQKYETITVVVWEEVFEVDESTIPFIYLMDIRNGLHRVGDEFEVDGVMYCVVARALDNSHEGYEIGLLNRETNILNNEVVRIDKLPFLSKEEFLHLFDPILIKGYKDNTNAELEEAIEGDDTNVQVE